MTSPSTSFKFHPKNSVRTFFPMPQMAEENNSSSKTTDQNSKGEEKPKFGLPPDYDSPDFNFKRECERLPFPLNIGEAPLDLNQQKRFIRVDLRQPRSLLSI